MSRYSFFQTNFSAGLLDANMNARADTRAYDNGCEVLTNWLPHVEGPVSRRPGTRYRLTLSAQQNIKKFVFSETQAYIFAFGETTLDIYYADDTSIPITVTGSPPWTLADFQRLRFVQYGDTMIVIHPDYRTKKIVRTSGTAFTISDFSFDTATSGWPRLIPTYKFHQASNVLTVVTGATAPGSSITITVSSAHFDLTGHVGAVIRVEGKQCEITAVTSSIQVTATIRQALDSKFGAGGVDADYWDEEAFTDYRGWPGCGVLHQQRLFLAGSNSIPLGVFSSNSADYFNFDTGTALANESIAYALAADEVSRIKSLVSGKNLQIFTDTSVYYSPETDQDPLTPSNFSMRRVGRFDINDTDAIPFETTTLYVSGSGNTIREVRWNELAFAYRSPAISLPVSEYIDNPIQSDVIDTGIFGPEYMALFVNTDGSMMVYHSAEVEEIFAWHRWTTNGSFKSVAVSGGKVFVVVERTINSVTKYFLEEFDKDILLDASTTSCSHDVNYVFGGFDYLAGETVDVNMSYGTGSAQDDNAYYLGEMDVSVGDIELGFVPGEIDIAAYGFEGECITAGFKYQSALKPMPAEKAFQAGWTIDKPARIAEASILLKSTIQISMEGQIMYARSVIDDMSQPPPSFDGIKRFHPLGWMRRQSVEFQCNVPLPCTVLGIGFAVEF